LLQFHQTVCNTQQGTHTDCHSGGTIIIPLMPFYVKNQEMKQLRKRTYNVMLWCVLIYKYIFHWIICDTECISTSKFHLVKGSKYSILLLYVPLLIMWHTNQTLSATYCLWSSMSSLAVLYFI